jgi:cyanophycinase
MEIKGRILLVGGGEYRGPHPEDKDKEEEKREEEEYTPLEELLQEPEKARIEIITTGTAYPRESFERYENYFRSKGVKDIAMLDIDSPHIKPEQIKAVEKASVVFFSGGNQRKVLEILAETEVPKLIKKRLKEDEDFIVGGTSAGSMILSELTIGDGFERNKLLKGDVDIRKGLDLIPGTIVDTHFLESMRLSRLSLAVLENPELLGIGLSENTGVIVTDGDLLEPVGNEVVVLIDASGVKDTNLTEAERNDPVYAMGIKLHLLSKGAVFSIRERRLQS